MDVGYKIDYNFVSNHKFFFNNSSRKYDNQKKKR